MRFTIAHQHCGGDTLAVRHAQGYSLLTLEREYLGYRQDYTIAGELLNPYLVLINTNFSAMIRASDCDIDDAAEDCDPTTTWMENGIGSEAFLVNIKSDTVLGAAKDQSSAGIDGRRE